MNPRFASWAPHGWTLNAVPAVTLGRNRHQPALATGRKPGCPLSQAWVVSPAANGSVTAGATVPAAGPIASTGGAPVAA